jgi:redox-sensitive bicupin YhaK (pirin superfamily)
MMKKIIQRANERGTADHGWLKANFSFSFAHYYNPEKVNFGALRVLNDDIIQAGMDFGTHPHDNMEIITIPLHTGEVQVMSVGNGLMHSEMNNSQKNEVNLF